MMVHGRRGRTAPDILDLGTRQKWVVSFTHRPIYQWGRIPHFTLNRRLGVHQILSVLFGLERNLFLLTGFEHLREEYNDFGSGTVCFKEASYIYHQLIFWSSDNIVRVSSFCEIVIYWITEWIFFSRTC